MSHSGDSATGANSTLSYEFDQDVYDELLTMGFSNDQAFRVARWHAEQESTTESSIFQGKSL